MDPWEMLSELCHQVVTEQNVCLNILIDDYRMYISLIPYEGNSNGNTNN